MRRLRLPLVWRLPGARERPLRARGVVAGADVVEGLLRERLVWHNFLPVEGRQPHLAADEGAAPQQRLRHPGCWGRSSWWRTREGLNKCSTFPRGLKPR